MTRLFKQLVRGRSTPASSQLPPSQDIQSLASLLTSNDTPQDRDIPFLHNMISDAQSRLSALDLQIESLPNPPIQLIQTRGQIAESIRQYYTILSAVRRLPSELLCEIFAITISAERVAQSTENSLKSPWRLSAVCRFWRTSALSYAHLWSFVTVPTFALAEQMASCLLFLETQIRRSATASLDVFCRPSHLIQLLDPVLQECERWRVLRLSIKSRQCNTRALRWLPTLSGRLSHLESLAVLCDLNDAVIPDVFAAAPRLKKVILTDALFMHRSPPITLPWGQITHYRGTYEAARHYEILQASPNLVDCTITCVDEDNTESTYSGHTTLYHLRRLALNTPIILLHLAAPSLEDLFCMYTWSSTSDSLFHFIRDTPSITRLTLLQCSMTAELSTALRDLPTLRYLCVEPETYPGTNSDETALLNTLMLGDICPCLRSFLYGVGLCFPRDLFFAMARFRFQLGEPNGLASLRIFNCGYTGMRCLPEVQAELQMLCDAGFDAGFLRGGNPSLVKAKRDFF